MTRETKVGLFVALSFLCLVGVVIAAKLRQVEDPEDVERLARSKISAPTPATSPGNSTPLSASNTVGPQTTTPGLIPANHQIEGAGGDPILSVPPVPPTANNPSPPAVPAPEPGSSVTPPPVPPLSEPVKPQVATVSQAEQNEKLRDLANAVKNPEAPGLPVPPPLPSVETTKPPEAPSLALPPKQEEAKLPGAVNATPPPVPSPALTELQKTTEPTPAKIDAKATMPGPPLGSPASFNSGAPQVTDYPVKPYYIEAGDTLDVISGKVYGSKKYARALHLFNRDYPLAKEGVKTDPPSLQPGQPVYFPPPEILQMRYASVIPAEADSVRPPGFSVGAPTPLVSSPGSPNNMAVSQPVAPRSPALITPGSDPARRYRVRETGEHILEIAQQTLGDRRRWSEIYRLNPQIRPDYPIPGGTELRLP